MENEVKVGDIAPEFSLPDVENRTRSLKEFLGQKVVLAFFVGAFTATCTKERCEFRDSMSPLIDLKAQVVGIDISVPSANKQLAQKNRLPFPVLSDYKHEVFKTYGLEVRDCGDTVCCWGTGCYPIAKRSVFVLDEKGMVLYRWIAEKPSAEPDYDEMSRILKYTATGDKEAKAYSIITISRQLGSGGDEIAQEISDMLGYAYFDKNLMADVARSIGVSEDQIVDFCEDKYKIQTLVDRISSRKRPVVVEDNALLKKTLDEDECLSVVQTVINSLAGRGKIVIVGRGGQAILKNNKNALHVRIIAPTDVRVERLVNNTGLRQEDALRLIKDSDKGAAEYLRRFYSLDLENPSNYDAVINTSKIDLGTAARMIASLATHQCFYP